MPTNVVVIQGKARNFVERLTASGKRVATFSVGFSDGGKAATFSYVNVNVWNLNQAIVDKLSAGWSGSVLVTGRLKQESWEGKTGKRTEVKIIADNVCLVAKSKQEDQQPQVETEQETEQKPTAPKPAAPTTNTQAPKPQAPKPQPSKPEQKRPAPQSPPPKPVEVQEDKPWEDDVEDEDTDDNIPF